MKRRMVVETHSAASICALVRAGAGISVVNPLTALDYAESGVVVRRFSVDVPFTVSLIRPLHRPGSALVDAFVQHLQTSLPRIEQPLAAVLKSINSTASAHGSPRYQIPAADYSFPVPAGRFRCSRR